MTENDFSLKEMLGELFTPVETPEAPNKGFFKGLFGGGAQSLDREELCKFITFFKIKEQQMSRIYLLNADPSCKMKHKNIN